MAFMQSNSSVMSIGAITSPCSNSETLKSRQSSIDSTHDYQLPSLLQTPGFTHTEQWGRSQHKRNDSEEATVISSTSDIESDSNYSCSPPSSCKNSYAPNSWLNSVYTMTDRKNLYAKEPLLHAFDMNEFGRMDYCNSQGYLYTEKIKTTRKGDALATRRARNKLASAKYRAKKQALTHAMQERIMQLATQVMALRDELNQTRNNEAEALAKYERLAGHFQQTNDKLPPL